MWLAPLPILVVAPRIRALPAFGVACLAWFLGGLNMWRYLHKTVEMPIPVVLVILILPAGVFGLAVLMARRFTRRGALWRASLALPVLWVAFEYIAEVTSPHSTWGNLGYTQMNFLPVLQVVSLTGIWGISFCVLLLSATIVALLSKHGTASQKAKLGVTIGLFLAGVMVYGSWRLVASPKPQYSVKVALLSTGDLNLFPHQAAAALELLRSYADQASALAAQGPQVIVLPEKIAAVSDQTTQEVDALFETTASRAHAMILVGLDRGTETRRSNEARLYSPGGALAAVYDKHHLIPRFEDVDQPGTSSAVLTEPSGIWGIEICKDMDFPQLSHQYGADGIGLLLVPAWDFILDGWLHGRMAIMRGVESGFTIARAAKQGELTVTDDRGRLLADWNQGGNQFVSISADAPVRHDSTLYVRWGDWFAWTVIAALAFLLLSLLYS